MKLNTLDRLQVYCPSLLTNFWEPSFLVPYGGIGVSGVLNPGLTSGEGLELLDLTITANWGMTQSQKAANLSVSGTTLSFSASFPELPVYSVVCSLEIILAARLKRPDGNIVWSTTYYTPGFQWPNAAPPSVCGVSINTHNSYMVNVSAEMYVCATDYQFELRRYVTNEIVDYKHVYGASMNPGLLRTVQFNKPTPNETYKIRARVGNLALGWSEWGEVVVPGIAEITGGSISHSIDEQPDKNLHRFTISYSNVNVPQGVTVNNVKIRLHKGAAVIEIHDGLSVGSGSYTFSGMQDAIGGNNYSVYVIHEYTSGGAQMQHALYASFTAGYAGNE